MSTQVYRFAAFTVDVGAHALLKRDTHLPIQEQPFQVLLALLDKPGQVVTREALCRRLWGTTTFVDFDQSLNSAVRRLRLALEDDSRDPVFVETLPRLGFRFLAEVAAEEAVGAQGAGAIGLPVVSRTPGAPPLLASRAASGQEVGPSLQPSQERGLCCGAADEGYGKIRSTPSSVGKPYPAAEAALRLEPLRPG